MARPSGHCSLPAYIVVLFLLATIYSSTTELLYIVYIHIASVKQIKQCQKEQPIVEVSKAEVEEKKVVDYVLRDDDPVAWWRVTRCSNHPIIPSRK